MSVRILVVEKNGKIGGQPFTLTALQKKLTEVLESGATVEKPNEPGYSRRDQESVEPAGHAGAHSKLLTLLSKADEEVDMRQVSSTLEQDPALSAKVMRTCRSAYFGFQET